MVKLSCFGTPEPPEDFDVQSNHSGESTAPPTSAKPPRLPHILFPHKRVLNRHDAKQRLKKILNVKKDQSEKERPVDDDPEYIILGKIYSELDATVDLASIARNRETLSHLLPFLLNALLYGYNDQFGSGLGGGSVRIGSGGGGGGGGGTSLGGGGVGGYGTNSNRSAKKSSNLKMHRDPKQITLGGTAHLVKAQCEKQLEQFLYQQALNSVQFALECVWYLTTSLSMGPKESYHRTMTLLLGMESVVATSAPPGDLFKKAAVTETASAKLTATATSAISTDGAVETPDDISNNNNNNNNNQNSHNVTSINNNNININNQDNNNTSEINTTTATTTTTTTTTNTTTTKNSITSTTATTTKIVSPSTVGGRVSPNGVPDRVDENSDLHRLTSRTVREVDFDITGSGENDHRMQFNAPLKVGDEEKLQRWLDARRERANIFHAQLDFVKCLTHISQELFDVEREFRRDVLRRELERLNDYIPKNVFIPTERRPHRVLRIVPESAHVFSTKERVPYLLVLEVEDLAPPPPAITATQTNRGAVEKEDEGRSVTGPLRRIGSIGASGMGKAIGKHSTIASPCPVGGGGEIVSTPVSGSGSGSGSGSVIDTGSYAVVGSSSSSTQPHAESQQHHHHHHYQSQQQQHQQQNQQDSKEECDVEKNQLQNKPESKFEFSPDVTAEVNTLVGTAPVKRESSFRVDAQHADDRRPPDEELLKALGEGWRVKSEQLRKASPFGSNPNWRLISCIVKARDQLRQEMFAQRLIQEFARIFEGANIPVWLRAYQILSTSHDSGLIETVTDAISIDSIKKQSRKVVTLQDYFAGRFGGRGTQGYKRAVRNFVQSMAGYSIVQYLLNIKDRHNGNLMIDAEGHVIHIDFGFLLSNSPGGNMEFEKSPFKLTNEMVQVMGGAKSGAFKLFKKLCVQGYLEACRYANKILLMVDIMYPGNESMPCFLQGREYVLENMRERFGVDLTRKERASRMLRLIQQAHGNWTTKAYDHFQKVSLGIAK